VRLPLPACTRCGFRDCRHLLNARGQFHYLRRIHLCTGSARPGRGPSVSAQMCR